MRISLKEAVQLLLQEQVIAVPTETVYGLAGSLYSEAAIESIFQLKQRPRVNPLIIHVKDAVQALSFVRETPPHTQSLMSYFWPGPLTFVLPIQEALISSQTRANLNTAAFRAPKHPLLQELLDEISPIVAPSANLSGKPSATRYEHVEKDFGKNFPVLDGGVCTIGLESTVIAYREEKWHIARLGAISAEDLRHVLGYTPELYQNKNHPISPGQLFRHYAPHAKLYLQQPQHEVHTIVGFQESVYPEDKIIYYLGSKNNPHEVSQNLFHVLRQLDVDNIQEALCDMDFPTHGIWISIRERITKASNH